MLNVKYKPNPWLVDWNTSVFFQKVNQQNRWLNWKMHIRRRTWFLQNKFTKLHNTILQRIVGIRKKNTCVHNYCAVICLSDDNTRSKKKKSIFKLPKVSIFALIIWIQTDTDFKEHYPQVHFLFFVSIEPCPDFPNWTWTNLPSVQYFKNLLQNNI